MSRVQSVTGGACEKMETEAESGGGSHSEKDEEGPAGRRQRRPGEGAAIAGTWGQARFSLGVDRVSQALSEHGQDQGGQEPHHHSSYSVPESILGTQSLLTY